MSRKAQQQQQREKEARQKDCGGGVKSKKCCCTAMAPRLLAALAMALAFSFAYALLLVLSSHSCIVDSAPQSLTSSDSPISDQFPGTSLGRIAFAIAATARLWERRSGYVKTWWRPNQMRGFVWLDEPVRNWSSGLPPYRISSPTSAFAYTHKRGRRSAVRIARIVSETVRAGLHDVDWYVMGDDDTVFLPDNLVRALSKFDHSRLYYIGASSESHHQNLMFSYSMAYGGGGFAISTALATLLEQRHDDCIRRYPYLYGSDDRMHACMAELGVPLTRESGFHQMDVFGDVTGLLSAHPISPFISVHHLDVINPIFPGLSQVAGLRHLFKAVDVDSAGVMQQSICYDRRRRWSVSVSFGYLVKVVRGLRAPRDLETPTRTFASWNRRYDEEGYSFTTRPGPRNACEMPVLFHMTGVAFTGRDGLSVSNYTRSSPVKKRTDCKSSLSASAEDLRWVSVIKERADDSWFLAPRRQCCHIMTATPQSLELFVRDCVPGELIG